MCLSHSLQLLAAPLESHLYCLLVKSKSFKNIHILKLSFFISCLVKYLETIAFRGCYIPSAPLIDCPQDYCSVILVPGIIVGISLRRSMLHIVMCPFTSNTEAALLQKNMQLSFQRAEFYSLSSAGTMPHAIMQVFFCHFFAIYLMLSRVQNRSVLERPCRMPTDLSCNKNFREH